MALIAPLVAGCMSPPNAWEVKFYNEAGVFTNLGACEFEWRDPAATRHYAKSVDRHARVRITVHKLPDGSRFFYEEILWSNGRVKLQMYTEDKVSCEKYYPLLFDLARRRIEEVQGPLPYEP